MDEQTANFKLFTIVSCQIFLLMDIILFLIYRNINRNKDEETLN